MSNSIAWDDPSVKVIVGVDTHKHEHVAVAINDLGARLATFRAPANRAGYADLVAWARTLGAVEAFGTEGTGSYGAGLASFVRREGLRVVEVNHCDRRKRRNNGKDDTLDAESAARSVLSGIATAIPKSADGTAEMVRQIKIARDTAIKARSAAIVTLKLLVNAPGALREALEPLTDELIERCAALTADHRHRHSLRALPHGWRNWRPRSRATRRSPPSPADPARVFGIGDSGRDDDRCRTTPPGDPTPRLRSSPPPASSGVTPASAVRGGHRQDVYRLVIVRMRWHQPHATSARACRRKTSSAA